MASEAVEKSLRAEIEKYFNSSLNELRGEISRLQNLLNDAVKQHQSETNSVITKLMESVSSENGTIVAVLAEQVRAVNEGAGQASPASSNDALIRNAVVDLSKQKSQGEILKTLVAYSASLAPRVAFFIIKDGHAKGWRARGFEDTVTNQSVAEIALPLTSRTFLSEAVKTQNAWNGEPGSGSDDHELLNRLGGMTPKGAIALPLVARGRSVAVLYADSGREDTSSINLDALEVLVRVAGMNVELLAGVRPATAAAAAGATVATKSAPATQPAAPQPEPEPEPEAFVPTVVPEEQPEPEPTPPAQQEWTQPEPNHFEEEIQYQPEARSSEAAPVIAEPLEEEIAYTPVPTVPEEKVYEPVGYATVPLTAPTLEPAYTAPVENFAPAAPVAPVEPSPERQTYSQATPTQTTPVTPTPTSAEPPRSYGRKDIDLPIEVNEEERRYHNEARRFARLLVSEIKLYNEPKVKEGREGRDLYERLQEAIDRSREMYDKRVHNMVSSRFDYFHFELVNTLAEGDEGKLGRGYPGSSV